MAAIRKRGHNWQVQVRRLGQSPVTRTFSQKSNALEWARLMEAKADRNDLPPSTKILGATSLGQLVESYLGEVVPRKRGEEIERITLNAFLREPICRKKLSAVTSADFTSYRERRLETVSTKTFSRQVATLSNMFRIARHEWGIPIQNPIAELRLDATGNRRERRLGRDELARLLQATTKTRNPQILPIVLLALDSAMRRGEILAMRWNDLDLERRLLVIPVAKNGHSRTIPLSMRATDLLKGVSRAEPQVFSISPVALRLGWTRLVKRAGISDLRFHDLRHEAISRFFEKGLTVPEVASISGHRDIRMLMRYAHADMKMVKNKLDGGSDNRPYNKRIQK